MSGGNRRCTGGPAVVLGGRIQEDFASTVPGAVLTEPFLLDCVPRLFSDAGHLFGQAGRVLVENAEMRRFGNRPTVPGLIPVMDRNRRGFWLDRRDVVVPDGKPACWNRLPG